MSDIEQRNAEAMRHYIEAAKDRLDDALEMLVPHMNEQQIRTLLEERHKAAFDAWMDHLSKPEPID